MPEFVYGYHYKQNYYCKNNRTYRAGPLFNYILALLLIMISMGAFGQPVFKVGAVAPYEGAKNPKR